MDTFPYADWAEALEANGAIYTWADNESAIFVLTALGIAAFVLSLGQPPESRLWPKL